MGSHGRDHGTNYYREEVCEPNGTPSNVLRLNFNAGDGVGIDQQTKKGHWRQVAYVNTGAVGSSVALAQDIIDAYNEKHT